MKTVFVSGHMHVTDAEFNQHYAQQIEALLAAPEGTHFLVADAPGFDTKVQGILADSGAKVTVYHMKSAARVNVGEFETVGGFATAEERDAAMTAASSADLAWVRPGRSASGVGDNLKRRAKQSGGMLLTAGADENATFNAAWGASEDTTSPDDDADDDDEPYGADGDEDEDEDEDGDEG